MGRRFKISGSHGIDPKTIKKILNKEALAYGRYVARRLKADPNCRTIPYSKNINPNNMTTNTTTEETAQKRLISLQAQKLINPLKAIFDFDEPTKASREPNCWAIRGIHKGRPHVMIDIIKRDFGIGIKYRCILRSELAPDDVRYINLNDQSLVGLVENINNVLNFRM